MSGSIKPRAGRLPDKHPTFKAQKDLWNRGGGGHSLTTGQRVLKPGFRGKAEQNKRSHRECETVLVSRCESG